MEASERGEIKEATRVWTPGSRQPARVLGRRFNLTSASGSLREGRLSRRSLRRDALYRRYLAVGDVVAAYAAVGLAAALVGQPVSTVTLAAAPLVVLLAKVVGLYDRDELILHKTTLDEAPAIFQVATVFTLTTWIVDDIFDADMVTPTAAALVWPLLFTLVLFCRASARRIACRVTAPERCLVIGNGPAADSLNRSFARSTAVNAEIVGRVPLQYGRRQGEDPPGVILAGAVPVLGDLDALGPILRDHQVERVLIAPGAGATDELLVVTRAAKALGARVSLVPRLFEVVGASSAFDSVEGGTLLGLRRYGLSRSSWRLKRAFDLTVALVALIVLAPLLLAIALAIKLDDRGPVLFRQRRVGQDAREFEMLKFRTMTEDAEERRHELEALNEAEGLFKIADDPRITRAGKVLRKTSLDEMPQLLNVLLGDMSLVGPRPLIPDDDSRVSGWDRRRLNVPPGMTGHWQILGSSRVPLGEMVKIDYLYGANWSLWGDLKILVRTLPYVLARRGQ